MSKHDMRISTIRGIYSYDFNKNNDEIMSMMDDLTLSENAIMSSEDTISKIIENISELDETISTYLKKWTIDRLPSVDRAILRVAAYELLFCDDIPIGATINEAVEIAKEYGTEKSSGYINGVLSSIAKSIDDK